MFKRYVPSDLRIKDIFGCFIKAMKPEGLSALIQLIDSLKHNITHDFYIALIT